MKRKIISKAMAALLTCAMAAGTLAGCKTPASNNAVTQGTETKGAETSASDGSYADYSNGFKERVTIQIPVYDRAFEGWSTTDNYYTKWVQSEFGEKYNVNVEYVSIGRTTEVQDYMQLIAAGNAPDIIMHYDMPQAVKYYNEEAMQELDLDEIANYAPNYFAQLGDTIKQYGQINGTNSFFFAERDQIYYNYVTLVRQDWLDKVNMEMPTNRAELEAVVKAWQEVGLGNISDVLKVKSFIFANNFLDSVIDKKDELALYLDLNVAPFTWAPTETFLRTMNKEYNEGIFDQEFYLNKEEGDWKADFVSGKVGNFSFYIQSNTDVITSLLANDPEAKVSVLDTRALTDSGKNYYYEYPPYGMIMGINADSTDEERIAVWMFLDWMIQQENLFYFQNGVEGENYTLDEGGIPMPVADFAGESKLSQNNNKDYWCLVQEIATYGDEEKNYKANLRKLAPAGYEYLVEQAYECAVRDDEYGVISPIFTKSIEASNEYSEDLNAMWQEFYVDLITCKPEEFDAKYKEYSQEYLDGGYQEILDEKQALIDSGDVLIEE